MMGKVKDGVNRLGLRIGNTIATPFRIVGEGGNALANVLRQGKSSAKNSAEVARQTIDALVDNFLNFSKVEGKRYQRLAKGTINAISACTRRPFMIAGAGIASGINQGMRQPFKKLLYTPGKMFKGMRNAIRIFNKKKGFDFVPYDTHETGKDTRVNQFKEKRRGFLGAKKGSSESSKAEKKVEEMKKDIETSEKEKVIEKKSQEKTPEPISEVKISEQQKKEEKPQEKKEEKPNTSVPTKQEKKSEKKVNKEHEEVSQSGKESKTKEEKPKSLDEMKEKNKQETEAKDRAEAEKKERKSLDRRAKNEHEKEFRKLLNNDMSEEGVLARAKKNNKGENIEQVLANLKKNFPTFAGYIEEEIINKKASAKTTKTD